MPITVKTSVYEGPLDLLLDLIEKRKLLINDISLASVTDEYVARIGALPQMPVGETADFVSLAATLLLIKSRSLLPTLSLSPEESRDIEQLEYRLALYKIIKEAARDLKQYATQAPYLHEGVAPAQEPLYLFDASVTLTSLRSAAQALLDGFPTVFALPKVAVKKIATLEEMIEKLAARVSSAFRLSFKDFNAATAGSELLKTREEIKHTMIVSFLALLELVKQGIIRANQSDHFGDIVLEADAVSTPTYYR